MRKSVRILLVDEDCSRRTATKHVLEQEGYGVVATHSCNEDRILLAGGLELLLIDNALYQRGGWNLATAWRQTYPESPILVRGSEQEQYTDHFTRSIPLGQPIGLLLSAVAQAVRA